MEDFRLAPLQLIGKYAPPQLLPGLPARLPGLILLYILHKHGDGQQLDRPQDQERNRHRQQAHQAGVRQMVILQRLNVGELRSRNIAAIGG